MTDKKGTKRYKPNLKKKKIMLGCPEDAEIFLEPIKEAIKRFNDENSEKFKISLELNHWKEQAHSSAENTQSAINKQLCDTCDCLIALFYKTCGHALTSRKPGTFMEIEYFRNCGKQVFLFKYEGTLEVDLSNHAETDEIKKYFNMLEKEKKNLFFSTYNNKEDLKSKIVKELCTYFGRTKKGNSSTKTTKRKHNYSVQEQMREHIRFFDKWLAVDSRKWSFSFLEKAENLIEGMQDDGSVQYYIGKTERFRTTPTASTLEALYLADFLPTEVCKIMQDWVYNSRQDTCDEPGTAEKSVGHKPDDKDQPGWSWNEGVSVWATSKALDTLILTKYYERDDVCKNQEIIKTTRAALEWLAEQQYPSGGWGFQYAPEKAACEESVTMTALALRVITRFLFASPQNKHLSFDNNLERKLSVAKSKGINYLIKNKKTDKNGYVFWEYDGKPSLTGTVWVLDFLNLAVGWEAGELNKYREEIAKFCINSLPSTPQEYEGYNEEVYFVGGETKYKTIEIYSKFYSYMPYHIPVILNSGGHFSESELKNVEVCMLALIKGKDEYWNGTDKSLGNYQHPSCFVRAMALYVVAFWMKWTWKEFLPGRLQGDWEV